MSPAQNREGNRLNREVLSWYRNFLKLLNEKQELMRIACPQIIFATQPNVVLGKASRDLMSE